MSRPLVVSLDCAQTLVETDWNLSRFVMASCAHAGFPIGPEAAKQYEQIHGATIQEFLRVNRTKDPVEEQTYWRNVGERWLAELGEDPAWAERLQASANEIGFSASSILFRPYEDVRPCLAVLREQGYRLIVLSNWDMSLRRVLGAFDLIEPFEHIFASLEEGVEKPDPRFFALACERLGVGPEDVVHIGDHPNDDVEGAKAAGMRWLWLDRSATASNFPTIASLRDLPEALDWIA
ncbi:MAG: HAD family hydrolase [Fimbriimonas sp.]